MNLEEPSVNVHQHRRFQSSKWFTANAKTLFEWAGVIFFMDLLSICTRDV